GGDRGGGFDHGARLFRDPAGEALDYQGHGIRRHQPPGISRAPRSAALDRRRPVHAAFLNSFQPSATSFQLAVWKLAADSRQLNASVTHQCETISKSAAVKSRSV